MAFTHLYIKYCNPSNRLDTFTLQYKLRDNPIVPKWCERLESAQAKYSIDDPSRFYGLGSIDQQHADAIQRINLSIETINRFEPIIDRTLTDVNDQDTLNYLHHIFEVYHGTLDRQTHEFWSRAPKSVQLALADLNIYVHRCEDVQRRALPRHVVTYYGLPKTETLAIEDYNFFEDWTTFGTVYLNYVEIGKTLGELAMDNDAYIFDTGFQPFRHYSADFAARFWSDTNRQIDEVRAKIKEYYTRHQEFFLLRNLPWGHEYLLNGSVPLADLEYTGNKQELINNLATHQWVDHVTLL